MPGATTRLQYVLATQIPESPTQARESFFVFRAESQGVAVACHVAEELRLRQPCGERVGRPTFDKPVWTFPLTDLR